MQIIRKLISFTEAKRLFFGHLRLSKGYVPFYRGAAIKSWKIELRKLYSNYYCFKALSLSYVKYPKTQDRRVQYVLMMSFKTKPFWLSNCKICGNNFHIGPK